MKKNKLFLTSLFAFFCLIKVSNATEYIMMRDAVYVRKGPGTNYPSITLGQVGNTYNLMSSGIKPDEGKNGNCDEGWYEINYNGEKAYVCSSYVQAYSDTPEADRDPSTACETEMKNAGFPSSYWSGLCSLKEKHPNWQFKAISTNLDWTTAVNKESSCGKSLISTSNSEYLDSTCSVKEGPFKAASQKAVAFYMDPRNFLTEKYIFQFEYLKYDSALEKEYANALTKMFGKAAFYTYHRDLGNDLPTIVAESGKETDVSPIFLGARMYQEMGTGTSLYNLYSGVYVKTGPTKDETADKWDPNEYLGYYNFFNIGVSTTCNLAYGTTYCGLSTARARNWYGVKASVKGASSFLSGSYINVGQYTAYLQKYNVVPINQQSLYTHQYMTNIMAPSSEAITTFNSYNKIGLIDSAFAFYIPVYKNMNANITNNSSGGTGGSSSSSPITTEIGTIITSSGYKVSGDNINDIKDNSTASSIKKQIEAIAGTGNVEVTNANGLKINDEKTLIGTGCKIKVTNANGSKTYTVVIKGDTSGDGKVNALDLLQVQKSILKVKDLKDAYKLAGDTSGDGKVNALDLLQVQKHILGVKKIN